MSSLRNIQMLFSDAMTGQKHDAVAGELCRTKGSPLRSIALYRRLIRINYLQVLKITYPVLYRLVGERYFGILARGYLKLHPSTSGDLFPYGRYFPFFLEDLNVPALFTHVAKLEWACHEVYQAPDSLPVSWELQSIALTDPSRVTLQFHPAFRLLSFPCPVHRVWLALQPEAEAEQVVELPLLEEETGIVVTRPFQKVEVMPLAKRQYVLLEALYSGKDLASVYQMGVDSDPEFDLTLFFTELLKYQIVSGFSVGDSL
ncbi:MAG: putative DNA-binding domain-containing protein [Nitrospirae bacterium]|nr:putative DNA-binding domain-containing protein [Nitrospirota bacterium]